MPLDNDDRLPLDPPDPRLDPGAAGAEEALRFRAAARGLDGLNLVVANVQTGFGPFVAVFLTSQGWTQTAIGVALSVGTVTAMASQIPAGALVDVIRRKSLVALFSVLAFAVSALMFAFWPTALPVYLAEILHGFSSCTLGPAIAALSLGLVGSSSMGGRLGRNARFASIGNGVGAALMGACGYYLPEHYVFYLTAILTVPAFAAIRPLARFEATQKSGAVHSPDGPAAPKTRFGEIGRLLADRRLSLFAFCAALFTFGNAPLLPLIAGTVTKRAASEGNLLVAACIILPQMLVALLSPTVGRIADQHGRRLVVVVAFVAMTLRALCFAWVSDPGSVVMLQALDGVSGACFGVMVPLVTSDIAGKSGHFNLCLGIVGFAIGIGATLSTSLAGWAFDDLGEAPAFLLLAAVGALGTVLAGLVLPETRPAQGR
jgi:MFS family permease